MTPIVPPQFQRPAPTPIPQFHWSRIGAEAEVTPEMIAAAVTACNDAQSIHWNDIAPAIYRAMHSVAPVPLVSPAEDAMRREITALTAALKQRTDERDTANADLTELSAIRWGLVNERNAAIVERDCAMASCDALGEHLVTLQTDLKAAQDALAKAITPTLPPQAPDPIANAIRPRETDRRRIGG